MITHKITLKAKARVIDDDEWGGYLGMDRHYHNSFRNVPRKLDKISYTQFITKLPCKIGDLLVVKSLDLNGPEALQPFRWYVVSDIQELHQMANYTTDLEPQCLYLQPLSTYSPGYKAQPFWSNPLLYKVVEQTSVPQVIKDAYANLQNQCQAN